MPLLSFMLRSTRGRRAGLGRKGRAARTVAKVSLQLEVLENRLAPAGTWTALTHLPPSGSNTMMLLSNGNVMMEASGVSKNWYQLKPDNTGSYVNGTWSAQASMSLERLYYGSNIMRDGRVFLVGGEYTGPAGDSNFNNTGEIYNPVTNAWVSIANFPQTQFGDDPTAILPDGRILAGYLVGAQTYIYNPQTNAWTFAANKLRGDRSDEETWVLLPDGSVLSYDIFSSISTGVGHAQRYVPSTNTWVDAGIVPVQLSSASIGDEMGPGFLLPDGRAFFVGCNGNTAYYTPSSNTWVAGPVLPTNGSGVQLVADDAPGAMMPNGHILLALDTALFQGPTSVYEFDPSAGTFTNVTPVSTVLSLGGAAYTTRMLMLPSGQVLMNAGGSKVAVYTPSGLPDPTWKPTISGVQLNGDGSYTLTGTQLNGISEGASYGDDAEMASNYPLIRLVDSANKVWYARTYNWSSTGVATGSTPVTTDFALPSGFTVAGSTLYVVANGIASNPFAFGQSATHFTVNASTSSATAGSAFNVTVTALDSSNGTVTGYSGTIRFTSSDGSATLPANATLTNGVGTFNVTLKTAGSRTVTAADIASSTITGSTAAITVNAAAASHYVVTGTPTTLTAGNTASFTVTALDSFNNTATGYTGSVRFTSTDGAAALPANATLSSGAGVFAVVLKTAGNRTVTAIDTANSAVTGISNAITVRAATAAVFSLTAPSSSTAGSAFPLTVAALDTYGNTATGYTGSIRWSSTDGAASFPAASTLTSGSATFFATLKTAGNRTITAIDTVTSTLKGTSNSIAVSAAAANHFAVAGPSAATAGAAVNFTVTALDGFNNTATGYAGTVAWTATDSAAALPAPAALTSGTGAFSVTLKTAGYQSLTVTDTVSSSLSFNINSVSVSAAAASRFALDAPSSVFAGVPFSATVRALDTFGNAANTYVGTIHFSSSAASGQASLPADYAFLAGDNGLHTFTSAVTISSLGNQTLTVNDTAATGILGSAAIAISAPPATHFALNIPASVTAGATFTVVVTALDQFEHIVTSYQGMVRFTNSDPGAALMVPANYTFIPGDDGVHAFSGAAVLTTAGSQSLTVFDASTSTIIGNASTLVVAGPATDLQVTAPASAAARTPFSITVTARDSFGNIAPSYTGTVHFTGSDTGAAVHLPADYLFVASDHGVHTFPGAVTLATAGGQTLTATDTNVSSIQGASAVSVPVSINIPTTLLGERAGIVTAPINVNGLADALLDRTGLATATLVVNYDATLFTVADTDVRLGSVFSGLSGWNLTTNTSVPGAIDITLSTSGSGVIADNRIGSLVAIDFHVKTSAPFGAISGIDLAANDSVSGMVTALQDLNHGNYPLLTAPQNGVDGNDGIITISSQHHAPTAVDDNYQITERDASDDPKLAVVGAGVLANDLDPDFESMFTTELSLPQHGQLTLQSDGSFVYSPDVGYLGSDSFTYQVNDAYLNGNVATVHLTVTPRLSMPALLTGAAAGQVVVPITIDNLNPPGSGGLVGASLQLRYDPATFSVTNADVEAGAIAGGWTLASAVNASVGQIQITLTPPAAQSNSTGGVLANVTFHILGTAPGGTTSIDLIGNDGSAATQLLSATGAMPMRPAPAKDIITSTFVTVAGISRFVVTAPAVATAGNACNVSVTALDQFDNIVTGYDGTLQFTSTDAQGALPSNATLVNGVGTFPITLQTAGLQSLIIADALHVLTQSVYIGVAPAAATHFAVSSASAATAGAPITLMVFALDTFGNTATSYQGTVQFTSTDSHASLPSAATLTEGIGRFNATLSTAGSRLVAVVDTSIGGIAGSTVVNVTAGAAVRFGVSAPTSVTAGDAFTLIITALDRFNNTAVGYHGAVNFSSSDAQASLPTNTALASGTGSFSAAFKALGAQTLSIADAANPGLSATAAISIIAPSRPATHFAVSAPISVAAGNLFVVTVTALDQQEFLASGYSEIVHLLSSDAQATLSSDVILTGGIGYFGAILRTAGNQTFTAIDPLASTITGTSNPTSVNALACAGFAVGTSSPFVVAGTTANFTVTAVDPFNNPIPSYAGTVRFAMANGNGVLPINSVLTSGTGIFSATLLSAGKQTLSVTDLATGLITGNVAFSVTAAAASHFDIAAPVSTTAGNLFVVSVRALDAFGNTAVNYHGTVHFATSDALALLAPDAVLNNGTGQFGIDLKTAGNFSITVTDTADGSVASTSNAITVLAGPLDHFKLVAPSAAVTGNAFSFTTTAQDAYNNLVTSYSAAVHLSSSDIQAILLTDASLSSGAGVFSATLRTPGAQTIFVNDATAPNIVGASGTIASRGLAVSGVALTATGFVASFNKAFDPAPLNLYDAFGNNGADDVTLVSGNAVESISFAGTITAGTFTLAFKGATTSPISYSSVPAVLQNNIQAALDGLATIGPGNTLVSAANASQVTVTFQNALGLAFQPLLSSTANLFGNVPALSVAAVNQATLIRGSLLIDPANASITFIKTGVGTAGVLAAGTYALTFRSAADGFKDASGGLLDGNNDGVPGDHFMMTINVAQTPTVILSIPDFARGPDGASLVKVPNNTGNGIPITLSGATGVTDVTFNLHYDPTLLSLTGAANGPTGNFTLNANASGLASFTFHSVTPLSGNLTLGQLIASVPDAAAAHYKAKALLHLSDIAVNGGSIPVNNDGVQLVAYFGDVSADGGFSGSDASLISRIVSGMDSRVTQGIFGGLTAYSLLDPQIIADVTGNGTVDAGDGILMSSLVSGASQSRVPPLPTGLTITPVGPDPALALPSGLQAKPGEILTVPLYLDTERPPGSSGLLAAVIALRFDPSVFTISAADVHLGDLPARAGDWQLSAAVNQNTGEIGVDLFGASPLTSSRGGTLLYLTIHVSATAPAGTMPLNLVTMVNPAGQHAYVTSLSDAQGALVLHPIVTDGADDNVDGNITIIPPTAGPTPSAAPPAATSRSSEKAIDAVFANLVLPGVAPSFMDHSPGRDPSYSAPWTDAMLLDRVQAHLHAVPSPGPGLARRRGARPLENAVTTDLPELELPDSGLDGKFDLNRNRDAR